MYKEYLKIINEKENELFALSDGVWDNPETCFTEYKSCKLLVDFMRKEGFEVTNPAYGIETAFTAKYGNGKPIIGFLGEYDALAGLSQVSGLAEEKALVDGGNGHGCGHNLLGVGTIAAALAAKKYLEDGHSGTVIYFGCPAEEGGSGKAFMAREGAFSDLDIALCWHPGEVNRVVQYSSLANIQVLYRFYGKAAHAAGNPENGRSALDAVELMNVGTNFLREHMSSSSRIHYAILNSGGFSPNVVQPYASVVYLIRATSVQEVMELKERVDKIADGMAMATETRVEKEFIKSCANLIPNNVLEAELYDSFLMLGKPEFTEADYEYAKSFTETSKSEERRVFDKLISGLSNEENIASMEQHRYDDLFDFIYPYEKKLNAPQMGGSTDVGDASWQCPTGQIEACTWAPNSGGHSWQIVAQGKGDIAHKATAYCGEVLGLTAIKLYENPKTIAAAKEEFDARMKGKKYIPIPKDVVPRALSSLG